MSSPVPSAWKLYRSMFKEGDEVIVITDDDEYFWGKAYATEDYLFLGRGRGVRRIQLDWDDIRFMSHDGFPVHKLMGADGSKAIEALDTTDTQEIIRQFLGKEICQVCHKLVARSDLYAFRTKTSSYPWRKHVHGCHDCYEAKAVFGDPFMIEGVSATLLNPGNDWRMVGSSHEFEEVIVMRARDGAQGLLYDLPTIYHFEAA